MDWKYKHFQQTRFFPADRDVVWEAARIFVGQSLGWKITKETSEGFNAEGNSFGHDAVADVRIQSSANGTNLDLELLVKRAGATGFMLFDVGGYYKIQIRHWLDGVQGLIHQKLTDSQGASRVSTPPPPNKTAARLFNGCLALIVLTFGLWLAADLISAVIGLITGNLVLIGKRDTIQVHGIWARLISALILILGAWIAWRIMKWRKSSGINV